MSEYKEFVKFYFVLPFILSSDPLKKEMATHTSILAWEIP